MNKTQSELTVITKAKDLCSYIFTVTQKSPKQFRFTFTSKLQNLAMEIIENIYRANETFVEKGDKDAFEKRSDFQHEAMTDLKLLSYFAMLAMENTAITAKQYEQISIQAKIYDFQNLFKAHTVARLGKRDNKEVILFEMNLGQNLTELSQSLRDKTYEMSGYYNFMVYDPKERKIHALHYRDRVVQHCLCDEVLSPLLDRKLIYDNAACRLGKGTHFAIGRASEFLHDYYNKYGTDGYFLKCDIRKFFENIDHEILKEKMSRVIKDKDVMQLLIMIIDSFEKNPGKGLPLGNQTSQWFALYYLDGMDRLIKEKFKIKYYSRYMDDMVIIHQDKEYLKQCLTELRRFAGEELHLEFNEKTQIFPIKNGVDYLGFHIYLSDTGKVIRKVKQQTKYKYKRKLKQMQYAFANNQMELDEIHQVLTSYSAHLSYGHTYKLRKRLLSNFVLKKNLDV